MVVVARPFRYGSDHQWWHIRAVTIRACTCAVQQGAGRTKKQEQAIAEYLWWGARDGMFFECLLNLIVMHEGRIALGNWDNLQRFESRFVRHERA